MEQRIADHVTDSKSTIPLLNWSEQTAQDLASACQDVQKSFSVSASQVQLLLEYYYSEQNWTTMVRLASQAVVQAMGLPPNELSTSHLVYCYQSWIMALYNMNDSKSLRILAIHLQKMQLQYPELSGQSVLCRSLLRKTQLPTQEKKSAA